VDGSVDGIDIAGMSAFVTLNTIHRNNDSLHTNTWDSSWLANYTAYNDSWSSTYNSTYDTWAYNQTIPAINTILGWDYYNSTDFDIADYYTSAQTDTEIGNANTSLYNWIVGKNYLTSFTEEDPYWLANYSNFLTISSWNDTGLIKDWNSTGYIKNWNLIELDPYWSANQSSYSTTADIIAFGFYNSSDFVISDYYLKNNPFGYYNSTNPQTESDPLAYNGTLAYNSSLANYYLASIHQIYSSYTEKTHCGHLTK